MIHATHIRIGNYLQDSFGRPGQVISFSTRSVFMKMEHSKLRVNSTKRIGELDVDGIPLNEEWMLKFGFERTSTGVFFLKNEFKVEYDNHAGYGISFFGGAFLCGVEYVHNIQNVYHSLTGTELLIQTPQV